MSDTLDLAAIKELGVACANCQGGGTEWSGVEYAGMHEMVGCSECMGSGVDLSALVDVAKRLTAERDALRAAVVRIDAWARGNYGGAKSPAEAWPELDAILRAALSDAES